MTDSTFFPLREVQNLAPYKSGDILVLFGELFNRGYANGLVEEAERRGMTIVRATVGRRDKDTNQLRALTAEESANIPQPFINIPLEAGFDLEKSSQGLAPIDLLKDIKLSDWESARLDFAQIKESRQKGEKRFRENTQLFLQELKKHILPGKNILFAHLMAGGVPRAKIVMPVMNRMVKGTGDRYIPSNVFTESDIGKLCLESFEDVTAHTFKHLVELSQEIRVNQEKSGGHVSYVAYGYHGTEILIDEKYQWQSYSPYLQGWAKLKLEDHAKHFYAQGISCCVYNCPEILTNSSSIFQGVEVPLYPLFISMQKENPQSPITQQLKKECQNLLKDGVEFNSVLHLIQTFMKDSDVKETHQYKKWPQHSTKSQLEKLLNCSDQIISLHKDEKNLMTVPLSEIVFKSCGYVMLHDGYKPKNPVAWIGHDIVAKSIVKCLI